MIETMHTCCNNMPIRKPLHVAFILCVAWITTLPTIVSAKLLDRVVAVVEEDVITESELKHRVLVLVRQFENNRSALPPQDVLTRQILQRLIIERLQLQLAERRGIRIDDLSLDQAMRNLAGRNNLTLKQFHDALVQQGLDYATFREQMRDEMAIEQLRRRTVDQDIQVTESEIEKLVSGSEKSLLDKEYEYHIAHILIAVPESPAPEQIEKSRKRALLVHERAISNNNFAQIAIAASDAQDALQGGDLGWRNKAQLPTMFLQQAKDMLPGDVSKIAQSPVGFHIFKLLDKREIKAAMVNQVLCQHILLHTNVLLDDAATETKLKELKARIEQGEDFGKLAREYSDDTSSAVNGGKLNWSVSSNYVPAFQEVVDSLETGQISEPFKSQYGWHIVELLDTRRYDNTQEATHAAARDQIRQRKIEEKTELWLRQLRDESYVENRLYLSD